MIVLQFAVWLHPLLLGILSYLAYRYLPFRRKRFLAYFGVLFAAFLMDIFGLSFRNDLIDIIAQRLILFMLAEYLWSLSGIRHRRALAAAVVVVALFLGLCTWRWVAAGPQGVQSMWTARTDCTCPDSTSLHVLKDRRFLTLRGWERRYILSRYLPRTPLERRVDDWVTAEGYAETPFSYSWQPTGADVKLDLIDSGSVIWSLGEGL